MCNTTSFLQYLTYVNVIKTVDTFHFSTNSIANWITKTCIENFVFSDVKPGGRVEHRRKGAPDEQLEFRVMWDSNHGEVFIRVEEENSSDQFTDRRHVRSRGLASVVGTDASIQIQFVEVIADIVNLNKGQRLRLTTLTWGRALEENASWLALLDIAGLIGVTREVAFSSRNGVSTLFIFESQNLTTISLWTARIRGIFNSSGPSIETISPSDSSKK